MLRFVVARVESSAASAFLEALAAVHLTVHPYHRVSCFGEIVTRLRGMRERFWNAVGCLGAGFVADDTLESLPLPT